MRLFFEGRLCARNHSATPPRSGRRRTRGVVSRGARRIEVAVAVPTKGDSCAPPRDRRGGASSRRISLRALALRAARADTLTIRVNGRAALRTPPPRTRKEHFHVKANLLTRGACRSRRLVCPASARPAPRAPQPQARSAPHRRARLLLGRMARPGTQCSFRSSGAEALQGRPPGTRRP